VLRMRDALLVVVTSLYQKMATETNEVITQIEQRSSLVFLNMVSEVGYNCCFLAKQYIYFCRYNNTRPNIIAFKRRLFWRYRIEKYNASIQQRTAEFNAEWFYYKKISAQPVLKCINIIHVLRLFSYLKFETDVLLL
jgi:hypothetical protein